MTQSGFKTAQKNRNCDKKLQTKKRRNVLKNTIKCGEDIIEKVFVKNEGCKFARPKNDNKIFYESKY